MKPLLTDTFIFAIIFCLFAAGVLTLIERISNYFVSRSVDKQISISAKEQAEFLSHTPVNPISKDFYTQP